MKTPIEQLIRDDAVHRDVYLDPAIFALEMDRIFSSVWVYVAHESELREPGDFKTTHIGPNPVIVSRTADGEVVVFYNRCAHRGLTVCQPKAGHATFFRCAYHGWTYDIAGNLTGTPHPSGYDANFEKAEYGLGRVPRVEAYRGFIFASINPNVGSLRDWLAAAAPYLDAFADSSPTGTLDARAGVHRYYYLGNWKLAVEGTVDGYHPYLLHKSFFDFQNQRSGARSDMYSSDTTSAFVAALGNGHMVSDAREEFLKSNVFYERVRMSPGGPALIEELERTLGSEGARGLLSRTGGNGFNVMIFPNVAIIQAQIRVMVPIAAGRTNVEIYPTTLPGVPERVNQLRLRSHELFFGPAGFGSPDDLEAFNRTQRGLEARAVPWLDFSRGRSRVRQEEGRVIGHITDETHQREMYRTWRRLMTGAAVAEPVAR
jgi:phenylpropionate dioxygenase-like ring-hydroxylating dioxygenase large terminal subunit